MRKKRKIRELHPQRIRVGDRAYIKKTNKPGISRKLQAKFVG